MLSTSGIQRHLQDRPNPSKESVKSDLDYRHIIYWVRCNVPWTIDAILQSVISGYVRTFELTNDALRQMLKRLESDKSIIMRFSCV